ncbi:MAG: hypothetical protein LBM60_03220 [Clostridium sp.]|jgi:hypothetical protein|nr:hypothetical protein [Clostridium sp.]
MRSLIHPKDPYAMNWIAGEAQWGTVVCPPALSFETKREQTDDGICERFTFTNTSSKDVFIQTGDISIAVPFNDHCEQNSNCLTGRCHAHVWCGLDVSYIMALRVGGEAPHLGLCLTKGSLSTYSIERGTKGDSKERGDILLHPAPFTLEPGKLYELEWVLIWHEGEEDFYQKCRTLSRFIEIRAERYVCEYHQPLQFQIIPSFSFEAGEVRAQRFDAPPTTLNIQDDIIEIQDVFDKPGIVEYLIQIGTVKTLCRFLVQLPIEELVQKRCEFITTKQQYHNPNSCLRGAYLIYDNEERKMHYDAELNHNAGRERIVMGTLLADYLQTHPNQAMEESLRQYTEFVYRELFDEATGEVFQDAGREQATSRLSHYPWTAQFFIELYILTSENKYIADAYKTMKYYYEHGGLAYYAVEVPDVELIYYMEILGMENEVRTMQGYLYHHARFMLKRGTDYPVFGVAFDQRTVASAAVRLMKCSMAMREKGFLAAAEEHLKILMNFTAHQPDCRLYESALRHWDGFYSGKRHGFADTHPNHWSAVTGNVWACYADITGKAELQKKAIACFDSAMALFGADGSAACVHYAPYRMNGTRMQGVDPWANDQDFALYYAYKFYKRQQSELSLGLLK